MKITALKVDGLFSFEKSPIQDARGFFERSFGLKEFSAIWKERIVKQVNRTSTVQKGTVRGFHYQKSPHLEMKIVQCTRGRVLDFAIDLRKGSPTFLKTTSLELNTHTGIIIPEGFAHGFQTLENDCELLYIHSASYEPDFEDGISIYDSKLNIEFPLEVRNLSARDQSFKAIENSFEGIQV